MKPDVSRENLDRGRLFYFQAAAGKTLEPGVVAVIQTFGDRINFHPHLHFLVTEGGMDKAGVFHRLGSFDDARLAEVALMAAEERAEYFS